MRARITPRGAVLACGLWAGTAGCGDSLAPDAPAAARAPASLATSTAGTTTAFTYDPAAAQTFYLGGMHRIEFPAAAVCDPAVSTYGVTEWDQPCTPLTTPILVTSHAYADANGHARVDFEPELRFVPGKEVVLYLRDKAASEDPGAVIQWCGPDGACVDEAASQPAYQTKRDAARGVVYRAVKHFSGYLISAGRTYAY